MGILRWLRSFSPDLCAEQMYKFTFNFADDIQARAREYGLGESFSTIDAVSVASFAVIKAFERDSELPKREALALLEYKRAMVFELYSLHRAGKLNLSRKNLTGNEDFVTWCQKYFEDNFREYARSVNLDHAVLSGPSDALFAIVKNVLDQLGTLDVEKTGRFLLLVSMYYGDFYKLCKLRLG